VSTPGQCGDGDARSRAQRRARKSSGAPQSQGRCTRSPKEIELEDKVENRGAQMVREVAQENHTILAGDGILTDRARAGDRQGGRQVVAPDMNPGFKSGSN